MALKWVRFKGELIADGGDRRRAPWLETEMQVFTADGAWRLKRDFQMGLFRKVHFFWCRHLVSLPRRSRAAVPGVRTSRVIAAGARCE